jgi:biopolymer transport protein ExbD
VNLAVTKERKYFVDSKEVDVANLETELTQKIAGRAEPVIILHIDKDLVYQDFIDVMQIGDRLKCKMVCATAPSNAQ